MCGIEFVVKKTAAGKYCSIACGQKGIARDRRKLTDTITPLGYVENWDDYREERTRVHITKAEKALGRRLKRGEIVHHINLNKSDNRNCNLLICTNSYHRWLHHHMEVAWVREHPELKAPH